MKQVRVTRPVVVEERFETASWYRRIELKPGVYPMASAHGGNSQEFFAYVPGVVVASAFPSSFGGHQFGDGNVNKDVGHPAKWPVRLNVKPYAYWDTSLVREDGAIVIEEAA